MRFMVTIGTLGPTVRRIGGSSSDPNIDGSGGIRRNTGWYERLE